LNNNYNYLHVGSSGTTATQGAYLHWNDDSGYGATYLLNQKGTGAGGFHIGEVSTSGGITDRMTIDGSGNVGIGTKTPARQLYIANSGSDGKTMIGIDGTSYVGWSTYISGSMKGAGFSDSNGNLYIGTSGSSNTGNLYLGTISSSAYTYIQSSGGNVAIGSKSPTRQLYISNSGSDGKTIIGIDGTSYSGLALYVNGTQKSVFYTDGSTLYAGLQNGVTSFNVGGAIYASAFNTSSDVRLKENVTTLGGSLDKIQNLRGVSFNWKNDGKADIGVIAQEVEKVFPALVHTDEKTGYKSVEYANLVGPLIEAVKELKTEKDAEITALKKEIEDMKNKVD
jgi:hypothetical protein